MLLTEAGARLVQDLKQQADVPSLLTCFQRLIAEFGMSYFCIGNPAKARMKATNRRWDGSWPLDWYRHYASQDHLSHDPLVTRMNREPVPFRWSSTYARADARQRRVLDDMAWLGVEDGFAVPIHGPKGAIAGISIAAAKYDLSPQDESALHISSLFLQARMEALRPASSPALARFLTPRERECLEWVAAGKTDWEISQILSISEQTVHGYVQNAMTKLGARTRAQAVALAIQSSQIQP
jgi:LuxR family quorum sensing-dependent transcriptional regulator